MQILDGLLSVRSISQMIKTAVIAKCPLMWENYVSTVINYVRFDTQSHIGIVRIASQYVTLYT